MVRRWSSAVLLAACGLLLGGAQMLTGSPVVGVVLILLFGAFALVVSPRSFPPAMTDAAAREASARDGRPIVYWRPGCPFCLRLRATLGREADSVHWVDIWDDPDGAASVRAVADGDETVPTVVAAGRSYVNPPPALVRQLISR